MWTFISFKLYLMFFKLLLFICLFDKVHEFSWNQFIIIIVFIFGEIAFFELILF